MNAQSSDLTTQRMKLLTFVTFRAGHLCPPPHPPSQGAYRLARFARILPSTLGGALLL
jgi:hypothetical protein